MSAAKSPAILSRRSIIAVCVAGVAAAGAFAAPSIRSRARTGGGARSWWSLPPLNLARGHYRDWTPHRGTVFTLMGETGAVTVRLTHVKPMKSIGRRGTRLRDRAFSVHFAALDGALPAGDRVYAIRSARQAPMKVFFSPTADEMIAIFG